MQAGDIGKVNANARSSDMLGEWNIMYASGKSGLTALDGKIAKFRVSKGGAYENECSALFGARPALKVYSAAKRKCSLLPSCNSSRANATCVPFCVRAAD